MEEDFRQLVVSLATGARSVAWGVRPQRSDLPGISMEFVNEDRQRTFGGVDGSSVDRVQLDVWGESFLSARSVTRQLAPRDGGGLDCFQGIVGDTEFTAIFVDSGSSGFEDTPQGVIHRSRIDLLVHHKERSA